MVAPCTENKKKERMMKIMKKLIVGIMAALLAAFTGCTPTAEQINKTATAIGYAAGLVANQAGIKDDARNAIVTVLNEVRSCVPAEGQTFTDAWTPVIKAKVAELVAAGKINEATGTLVTSVAVMAAKAVDYLFDVRFPEAKQYEELVRAGTAGAIDGFLAVFKPVDDCDDCVVKARANFDSEAYEYFKKNLK